MSKLVLKSGFWVREDNINQDMTIVRDIYLEDSYRLSIIQSIVNNAKLVVDVGAHIGCFAKLVHNYNKNTDIVCVEVCPENIESLYANVQEIANILIGACTYEKEDLMLLNAVRPNCESTGGSVVVKATERLKSDDVQAHYQYWEDLRSFKKFTLEEIITEYGSDIDLLKLDCEGSEYSILYNTSSLDHIRFIVGEYHGRARWEQLLRDRFQDWDYGHMRADPDMGIFHLRNPKLT